MATADLIKNVFGDSDSDSDADAAAPAAAAKPTKAELRATAAKKAAFAAALGAVDDDDDDDDAGGDASDDDGSLGGDVVAEKPAFRSSLEDPDAAGSDSDDEKPGARPLDGSTDRPIERSILGRARIIQHLSSPRRADRSRSSPPSREGARLRGPHRAHPHAHPHARADAIHPPSPTPQSPRRTCTSTSRTSIRSRRA